ncbi:MAG TPA: OsmC family protein [Candidatus Thermoplasmatota archaeon]|nr:OsmC family protein [Candidatus Thermoplasmatota archaeon]
MTSTEIARAVLVAPKTTEIAIRGHTIRCDKPADLGGTDSGPMASEYLLAALASCTLTTMRKIAEKRKVELGSLACVTEMDFDDRGVVVAMRLRVEVGGTASDKDVETVFRLSEKACTISQLLSFPVHRALARG